MDSGFLVYITAVLEMKNADESIIACKVARDTSPRVMAGVYFLLSRGRTSALNLARNVVFRVVLSSFLTH